MKSLLLLSLILVTLGLPIVVADDPSSARALKRMLRLFLLFFPLYYFYIAYGHTRFFPPGR
jgi:hypothetical protein